jgi:hemoglobin
LLRLLNHFYADVRQHNKIGPIFNAQITNWPEHIENIADFWTQVCGGPAAYGGRMPQQHMPLGLREEHFQAWLRLWSVNCRVWVPLDCANELTEMANQISLRLRQFCGVPQPPSFKLHS